MNTVAELTARAEIASLKARYFRCMDTKDWAGLEAVFTPDLEADFRASTGTDEGGMITKGAAKYVRDLAPILANIETVHHGHMGEIEITGPDSARGVWAMEDKLWARESAPVPWRFMHGYGHYHETYRRIGNEWRIASVRLSRLKVEIA